MLDGAMRSPFPLIALLGPTNTGKTHQAVERMLEWDTGMIGLPLRLLAREVYDRVSLAVGEQAVALVTGEEKRIPPRARYFVCTVEAMPVDREVEFLAVDEIQLAAHRERGHVFTDRLLHARGRQETWFLGAHTMRPLVEQVLPTARVKQSPRFSELRATGSVSLAGLPPRSVVVAFSATQVYELAERVRQRKGGAAVVMGALSPKTRNAQVAMYQSGEVDYLVATDAIGMGLNMNVDHVAFAATRKFDGKELRPLEAAELAQIAGRAGRHMNDGSFGTLSPVPPLPQPVSFAIENHRFPAERRLVWRNSDLDTSSIRDLIGTLSQKPRRPELVLVEQAEDFAALCHLGKQEAIRKRANDPEAVALLWEVCQIPDYGGHLVDHHARLLADVYLQLSGPEASLNPDWIGSNLQRLDDPAGDLDELLMRIELVRTWTYISHHARWVRQAHEWQARAQAIEERLSDALHARLVARFVERSTARKRGSTSNDGVPAPRFGSEWIRALPDAPHERFEIEEAGRILVEQQVVAQLAPGPDLLHPEVRVVPELDAGVRSQLQRRLVAYTRDLVAELLGPLRRDAAGLLSPAGRGLVYQLEHGLGTVLLRDAQQQVDHLSEEDGKVLGRLDVVLGERVVFVRSLLKPRWIRRRMALCQTGADLGDPSVPSWEAVPAVARETYVAVGYPVLGPRAVRADVLERVYQQHARHGPRGLAGVMGCPARQLRGVIAALGQ
jgi:ATP-dependent RNA helicase SUPV3L1/SUV3